MQLLERPAVLRRTSRPASRAARDASGGSPIVPKSLGVRTSPSPKWCCQTRLTITRAVSGFSGLASQRASVRRRRAGATSGRRERRLRRRPGPPARPARPRGRGPSPGRGAAGASPAASATARAGSSREAGRAWRRGASDFRSSAAIAALSSSGAWPPAPRRAPSCVVRELLLGLGPPARLDAERLDRLGGQLAPAGLEVARSPELAARRSGVDRLDRLSRSASAATCAGEPAGRSSSVRPSTGRSSGLKIATMR